MLWTIVVLLLLLWVLGFTMKIAGGLIHLLLVTAQLYRALSRKAEIIGVGKAISAYLPVYFVWATIVTFLFPFLFGFK